MSNWPGPRASPPRTSSPTPTPSCTTRVYRHEYRVDLLREFPRLPFYHDFPVWKQMGQELLDLHIGFEEAEPYPLERVDLESFDPGSG